jgi:hypothetical protein
MPVRAWDSIPYLSLALGPDPKGHTLLLRARRSEFRFPTEAPGQPADVVGMPREGGVAVQGVQEIPDEEHEQVLERVCAIDVAKVIHDQQGYVQVSP